VFTERFAASEEGAVLTRAVAARGAPWYVVGEGLMHKIGVLAQAATALSKAGVNIKMANQGSSEMSMIFGIDEEDEKKAVRAMYEVFFK
jgi:aspartokinase